MKIAISLGLSDEKAWTYLEPLLTLNNIKEIHVIRHKRLIDNTKISYHVPPKWILCSRKLKTIYKFIKLWHISFKFNINIYYGVHMYPDGIMTGIVSKLRKKTHIISLIAGSAEIDYWGMNFSKFSLKILDMANYIMITGVTKTVLNTSNELDFLLKNRINVDKLLPGYSSFNKKNLIIEETSKIYDIVNIGRIDKIKRIDFLIEIIHILKTEYDINIKSCIVGNGSETKKINDLISKFNLENNVKLMPHVSKKSVKNILNQSKLFVLTSENEGLPSAICEALYLGIPVVSSNVGFIKNIISDDYNGYLVEKRDINTFCERIIYLLKNDFYENLYNNCIDSANQISYENRNLTWLKIFNENKNIY